MSLTQRTIKKLFRETFTSEKPLRVTNPEALAETIKNRIGNLHNVDIQRYQYFSDRTQTQFLCGFTIKDPGKRYHYGNDFRLIINEAYELTIHSYNASATVGSIEEIVAFIAACQARLDRQQAQRRKREKVRQLKKQAIVAQVKKIAQAEKFDFYTDMDTVKLKLFVKLSDKDALELHIPFKHFQETLPKLGPTINALREIHQNGIKFKISSARHYYRWITYEEEQTS